MNEEGNVYPLKIVWENGREYAIDKVIDIRRSASLKAGGAGIRFTCKISGQIRYLFLDEYKWFIETDK